MRRNHYGILLENNREVLDWRNDMAVKSAKQPAARGFYQAVFVDSLDEENRMINGIYSIGHDGIICLECGGFVEVEDISRMYVFDEWENLDDSMLDAKSYAEYFPD